MFRAVNELAVLLLFIIIIIFLFIILSRSNCIAATAHIGTQNVQPVQKTNRFLVSKPNVLLFSLSVLKRVLCVCVRAYPATVLRGRQAA